eukprot:TRINITY_DN3384_c0_g1_i1.p1 TRINITY_DN3384_c0_g1~~TRINITY_DN3384_c0_g1_i1.p1  ORF type:complete len:388 (+),score=173.34 TRINITY_DN3384_c0_g1_i1:45-1166(+)
MAHAGAFEERVARIMELRSTHPNNLSLQAFDRELFAALPSDALRERLLLCLNTSVEVPDSQVGSYAMHVSDYTTLACFFQRVLEAYHHTDLDKGAHHSDWEAQQMRDPAALALPEPMSARIRVGRNLPAFDLCGLMSAEQRREMENLMVRAFEELMADASLGGRYVSLTPGHKNHISEEEYADLVQRHLMFKRMDKDAFLKAAGISRDWPVGRGAYISDDEGFVVWVGEEDHLRIMCMEKSCTSLHSVFARLRSCYTRLERSSGQSFAAHDRFGSIACCPSNVGTCMRASVHMKLPALCRDADRLKATCKELNLSVRGEHGEHSAYGAGGLVDISPKTRMMITEAEIVRTLHRGIARLNELEEAAAAAAGASL